MTAGQTAYCTISRRVWEQQMKRFFDECTCEQ